MKNKKPWMDGHTHLENGPLSEEYVIAFVQAAKAKGLKTLYILDHTHRFYEFRDMYDKVCAADPRQKAWFEKKQVSHLQEYHDLIARMKAMDLGIELKFGLEVCYSPENEAFLREMLSAYPYDFLVGSVHSLDGKLYDMDAFSMDLLWDKYPAAQIYKAYYNTLASAIESGLFTQIGHPDVIKMYQIPPGYDLTETYRKLARLAVQYHTAMEDNTGAHYRYHHPQVGLDPAFRRILLEEGTEIVSASDAHYPAHVGRDFELLDPIF